VKPIKWIIKACVPPPPVECHPLSLPSDGFTISVMPERPHTRSNKTAHSQ